jgi:hypothetical protein
MEAAERARSISRSELTKHPDPDAVLREPDAG